MHVNQFFPNFPIAPRIEIVEPPLPERNPCAVPEPAGHFLFHDLNYLRGIYCPDLVKQQVHVFGHDHVPVQVKTMPRADLIQDLDESRPSGRAQ